MNKFTAFDFIVTIQISFMNVFDSLISALRIYYVVVFWLLSAVAGGFYAS